MTIEERLRKICNHNDPSLWAVVKEAAALAYEDAADDANDFGLDDPAGVMREKAFELRGGFVKGGET